jgi:hypothetical protein
MSYVGWCTITWHGYAIGNFSFLAKSALMAFKNMGILSNLGQWYLLELNP